MRTLPRVVAVDLDGTLLRIDGTLSDRTAATLASVRAAGTGRAFAMANAHPLVLAEIPGRALSNQDDGVAVMLESLRGEHAAELRS